MSRLRQFGRIAGSFLEASFRRLRGAARSEDWTFKFAVLRGYLDRTADEVVDWPIEKLRASHDKMAERGGFELPVDREEEELGGVPVEWFRPEAGELREGALIVYLHGGAYLFGSTRSHANLIGRLALETGMPVVGINYRLAPEHELEEGREDVISVWRALVDRRWSPEQMAMAGDSAGGGLSVSSALELARRGAATPAALGLISPWVDLSCSSASYEENEYYDYGRSEHVRAWRDRVVGDREATDPIFSPIYDDLTQLPPTLVHYGGGELLADDCRRFVEELEEAGVEVDGVEWPEMVHAFHAFYEFLPTAREAISALADYLVGRAAPAPEFD